VSEFVDHLETVFARFGPVSAKRMFGGYGLYHDGLMFGLIVDDVLYLKTDALSVAAFIERGLGPFTYERRGRPVSLAYHQAPEELYEDVELARAWAARAFDAALRARKRSIP